MSDQPQNGQQARRYTFPILKHFFLWKLRRRIKKESDEYFKKKKL